MISTYGSLSETNVSRRKICVVTTSRADYGLLRNLISCIRADAALKLQLIVSGMHLVREFGFTVREIEADGVKIDRRIDIGLSGSSVRANTESVGCGLGKFAEALSRLKPDIMVLLGDRCELLSPAIAALMLKIPIAHIHGGERSEGALDEAVRHAITKMSSLHFASTEPYRRRIIQMGESPATVFAFGAPGLDQIHRLKLLTRSQLEREIGFSLKDPVALVTFHRATRDAGSVGIQVRRLIAAVKASGLRAVFTMANADAEGAVINEALKAACSVHRERFKWFPHLGQLRYLSCLKQFAVMVGNSSSGLIEAPSFRLPVVNIGDRQRGRIRAANVIDVPCSTAAILKGIKRATSPCFRASLRGLRNPHDRFHDGRASERIKNVLRDVKISAEFLKKSFHDLPS
jgi:UDP-N-acetylglucosamine 2-epimerase (non-hydrolysing)/GDP/UDP-N,N'-diacetylbacillosamine 2-epimerase (hydrolysing)